MSMIQNEQSLLMGALQNALYKTNANCLKTNQENVAATQWTPRVDIQEEETRFILTADVPGVDPQSIQLEMENDMLSIRAERTLEKQEDNFVLAERRKGVFYRQFRLPDTADAEHINARSELGVLEIVIPKHEKAKPRKIDIKIENLFSKNHTEKKQTLHPKKEGS